ncbi:hypothetical protein [Brevundimonas sp. SL130]|uniref:hypothetical protein n=1 Tax=Brevundimonas sp. SL130 TaxID=2995143 RepID=UPI00226CFAF1|nr:hypothetical protein [Brevundimonas sp. SL130]WAC59196.1 hypothetical protein OU998_13355 [Brevundimonas sp. SL130]
MSFILSAVLALALQTPPPQAQAASAWTWTLYEGEGPMVLANELPDTPALKATLQCAPGSGVVDLALYDGGGRRLQVQPGFARLTSGEVTTTSEVRAGRGGRVETTVRTDHPLFAAFVRSGDMALMTGDQTLAVKVDRPHLAKLRRFADRCAG